MKGPDPNPRARSGIFHQNSPSSAVTLVPHFLDDALCRNLRIAMDRGSIEPAEILDDGVMLEPAARCASSIEVDTSTLAIVEARLDAARDGLAARCGVLLAGREGAGFIRYFRGGFYRPHRDRACDTDWPDAARRLIAVVIFLNSSAEVPMSHEFGGGELMIYPESAHDHPGDPIPVVPRQGSLVAFDASLLHEVRLVGAGTRDVIVDWYY